MHWMLAQPENFGDHFEFDTTEAVCTFRVSIIEIDNEGLQLRDVVLVERRFALEGCCDRGELGRLLLCCQLTVCPGPAVTSGFSNAGREKASGLDVQLLDGEGSVEHCLEHQAEQECEMLRVEVVLTLGIVRDLVGGEGSGELQVFHDVEHGG